MNINKIIKKALLEQETTPAVKQETTPAVKGLNVDDQIDILEKGKSNCPTFKKMVGDRPIKRMGKTDILKFPELGQIESAHYISRLNNDGSINMFFAIEDKTSPKGKKGYLTYKVSPGKPPVKYTNPWGSECDYMQQTSELGKDTMSDEERKTLQSFLSSNKDNYYQFVDNANQGEFVKVPYSKLTWPVSGRKVLPDYKGSGYLWKRSNLENDNKDLNDLMTKTLTDQNFTRVMPDDATSPEANSGFYLKDIAEDYPLLATLAKTSPYTKVWPMPNTLIVPDRRTCKTTIKLLHKCSKSSVRSKECSTNLWKNKMLALQCGDRNFVGSVLGIGDEFDQLLIDNGQFGLAKLKKARERGFDRPSEQPQGPDLSIKEGVKNIISKYLNEEYKRRNFRS